MSCLPWIALSEFFCIPCERLAHSSNVPCLSLCERLAQDSNVPCLFYVSVAHGSNKSFFVPGYCLVSTLAFTTLSSLPYFRKSSSNNIARSRHTIRSERKPSRVYQAQRKKRPPILHCLPHNVFWKPHASHVPKNGKKHEVWYQALTDAGLYLWSRHTTLRLLARCTYWQETLLEESNNKKNINTKILLYVSWVSTSATDLVQPEAVLFIRPVD